MGTQLSLIHIYLRNSYAECNRIAREAHSSFYLAFFGLRKPKRNALCALYAFMRLIDDVSDEPGDLESKRRGLARWRAMLDEAVSGNTAGPVSYTHLDVYKRQSSRSIFVIINLPTAAGIFSTAGPPSSTLP